ncbi:MAG: hypothetical protein ABIR47_13520 [Candidatus Kapaibacterium sp.]
MPELIRLLTDDHGTITHLVAEDEERLTVADLAERIAAGDDYYITFGEETHYHITIVAEDGHLEPTVDDEDGEHTIWDLPTEEDPAESGIEEIFEQMERLGEFDDASSGVVDMEEKNDDT